MQGRPVQPAGKQELRRCCTPPPPPPPPSPSGRPAGSAPCPPRTHRLENSLAVISPVARLSTSRPAGSGGSRVASNVRLSIPACPHAASPFFTSTTAIDALHSTHTPPSLCVSPHPHLAHTPSLHNLLLLLHHSPLRLLATKCRTATPAGTSLPEGAGGRARVGLGWTRTAVKWWRLHARTSSSAAAAETAGAAAPPPPPLPPPRPPPQSPWATPLKGTGLAWIPFGRSNKHPPFKGSCLGCRKRRTCGRTGCTTSVRAPCPVA